MKRKMNILEVKPCNPSHYTTCQCDVSIALQSGEATKLRDALALIQKYEKAAFKAIKGETGNCPTGSDWHSVQYAVKNDKIIVKVKDGMAG